MVVIIITMAIVTIALDVIITLYIIIKLDVIIITIVVIVITIVVIILTMVVIITMKSSGNLPLRRSKPESLCIISSTGTHRSHRQNKGSPVI